mgnify:CR=1 FL=1
MIELGMIGPFQMMLILGVVLLIGFIPTIIALIDILKSKFEGNNKIVWVLGRRCDRRFIANARTENKLLMRLSE